MGRSTRDPGRAGAPAPTDVDHVATLRRNLLGSGSRSRQQIEAALDQFEAAHAAFLDDINASAMDAVEAAIEELDAEARERGATLYGPGSAPSAHAPETPEDGSGAEISE